MAKRMLIDATHPEETRVVVLNGNRLEEFDFESSTKRQVKGNIYLAKITRVEPSLQAAFVDYGGNRHGFLAFSEIHPDYYRIPVADRQEISAEPTAAQTPATARNPEDGGDESGVPLEQALPEPVMISTTGREDEEAANNEPAALSGLSEHADHQTDSGPSPGLTDGVAAAAGRAEPTLSDGGSDREPPPADDPDIRSGGFELSSGEAVPDQRPDEPAVETARSESWPSAPLPEAAVNEAAPAAAATAPVEPGSVGASAPPEDARDPVAEPSGQALAAAADEVVIAGDHGDIATAAQVDGDVDDTGEQVAGLTETGESGGDDGEAEAVEVLGGDEFDEVEGQRSRISRQYKIQEVIKRRQIMLVQVTKEERGNKGAALTTYLSLAGRYCVLMPNTARGGGVSRKITNLADRRRLKEILEDLDIPEGMGVIVRTAGAERSKAEIKRDYEYLLRLWNEIRDLTLRSTAPALIYEEGDLIKRSIRDLYTRDIDEVLVEGEEGYRTAKAFMKMLMPSHARRVQPYRDPHIGLLHRFQVESQIDAIHSPIVQLRSGGYVVIDQTEALVAIDVNSGRATRERNIEETALRTNLEAAEEIARQLRLRDLAGLIVIDFIDMEEHRNQSSVERRLKEALKSDRARIQVGRISPFGLLEMSRQRLRSSLTEASTQPCPHCGGTGFIRSTESTALYVLRSIEEEGMRRRSAEVCVYVPTTVALYILNHKRDSLAQLETRYGIHVLVARDDGLIPPAFRLERIKALEPGESAPIPPPLTQSPDLRADASEQGGEELVEAEPREQLEAEAEAEEEQGRARRRRRRRRRDERPRTTSAIAEEADGRAEGERVSLAPEEAGDDESGRLRRRRGRRGGRRRARHDDAAESSFELGRPAAETIEIVVSEAVEDAASQAPKEDAVAPGEETEPQPAAAAMIAASEIETASLPALAGEALSQGHPDAELVSNDEALAPRGVDEAEWASSPERPPSRVDDLAATETRLTPLSPPPAAGEAVANPPVRDELRGNGSGEPAIATPAPGAAAETGESVAEPGSPVPEPTPGMSEGAGQIVQEVTRKPENPRRGWWQRLIQS